MSHPVAFKASNSCALSLKTNNNKAGKLSLFNCKSLGFQKFLLLFLGQMKREREKQNIVLFSFDISIGGRKKNLLENIFTYHFMRVKIRNLMHEFYNLNEEIFFI